ncbi:MAG: amidohydrolase family protein [Candidatus Latescibacteria bacterium]|nr:amidohydrolase family protein [Candidatus Latescibacterota bacterium]
MPPIVDSHLHIWSDDVDRYPRRDVPYPGSAELLLQYMDEAGVDHAVIVLPQYYQYDNRLLADTLRQHDDRFAGVGVIDPRGPKAADTLTQLVQEDGLGGVRLRGTIESGWFCQTDTDPLWQKAAQLNIPLCLLGSPEQIDLMRQMIERHPDTPVVIDHFAMIPASDGLDAPAFQTFLALARFPRVHIKLSGLHYWSSGHYPYETAQANLKAAVQAYGPQRILWGSDWPHILFGGGYIRNLNFVRRLEWLSEADKAQILGATAYRLWWSD